MKIKVKYQSNKIEYKMAKLDNGAIVNLGGRTYPFQHHEEDFKHTSNRRFNPRSRLGRKSRPRRILRGRARAGQKPANNDDKRQLKMKDDNLYYFERTGA